MGVVQYSEGKVWDLMRHWMITIGGAPECLRTSASIGCGSPECLRTSAFIRCGGALCVKGDFGPVLYTDRETGEVFVFGIGVSRLVVVICAVTTLTPRPPLPPAREGGIVIEGGTGVLAHFRLQCLRERGR